MSRMVSFLFSVVSAAGAYTAVQTDWSGGPGVSGPVMEFRNTFYQSSNIEYAELPGIIGLSMQSSIFAIDDAFAGATSIFPADIDGDGDTDLVGTSIETGEVSWWENVDGAGTEWSRYAIDSLFTGASSVWADDIDGDGDIDVLGASKTQFGAIDITLWMNEDGLGQTWSAQVIDGSFDGARSVCAADLDGDGDLDVLGAAAYIDEIAWWENMDGSATEWTKHTIGESFDGAWSVSAADMDADGDLDVIGTAYYLDAVALWTNTDGTGATWTRQDVATGYDGAYCASAADMNGDGSMDILGAAAFGDQVTWWDGRSGSWTAHEVDGTFDGAVSVVPGDFDSDGDIDVVGAAVYADEVRWWESIDGGWRPHSIIVGFDGAMSVCAADIDGDGEIDPLFAAMGAAKIAWWDRRQNSGYLESSVLDTGLAPEWDLLGCIADIPSGCSLMFQVRASRDILQMGDWSEPFEAPLRLSQILDPGDNLFQYRVLLDISSPGAEPYLDEVAVSWYQEGLPPGEPGAPGITLLPVSPNPARGFAVIRLSLEEQAQIDLCIFDISGRRVYDSTAMTLDAGSHQIMVDGLTPGLYLCRMVSGSCSAAGRFAVVE
jgi:hypothetical protein